MTKFVIRSGNNTFRVNSAANVSGIPGPAGTGDQGEPGFGIPTGGEANQLIVKNSATDFDIKWGIGITVSNAPPTNPNVGDIWVNTA